ncbi:MAG: amino acid deaminase/aldolase [Solirubrobacterales bacterium]
MASETDYRRYEGTLAGLESPLAFVDLDAMWSNANDMLRRAGDKPIRVASKSLRCRELIRRILERDERFRGLLTFTLPETLWLYRAGLRELVIGYPTTDRAAIAELAEVTADDPAGAPVLMVDCIEHLDLIESSAHISTNAPIRVAIELDTSYWAAGGRVKIGPKRSPIRTPDQAVSLARGIDRRHGVRLVGLMAYEGHIAGVGDRPPGKRLMGVGVRAMQKRSAAEIRKRRAAVVEALRAIADLEFVNGGGTGSIEATAGEPAVTDVAAGSGFYAPTLFDAYGSFTLKPAAMFALPVVRKPSPSIATVLGGGYLASGTADNSRLPEPHLPAGLRLDSQEGAGEVQTPLLGDAAKSLHVGDRVYFRHAKAGELCERFNSLHLVEGDQVTDELPTYRGEGKAFL